MPKGNSRRRNHDWNELVFRGAQLFQAGDFSGARVALQTVLCDDPHHPIATHVMGLLLFRLGEQEKGVGLLRAAAAIAPENAEFHNNLGGALGIMGRNAEAIKCIQLAIKLNPQLAEGYNNLGVTLEALEDYNGAETAYNRAIELRPEYAEASLHLGNVLRKLRRTEQARHAYQSAIRLHPDSPGAYQGLATICAGQGRLNDLISHLRHVIRLDPADYRAHSMLVATLHYHSGIGSEALLDEARTWDAHHGSADRGRIIPHDNRPVPGRRMRVGYLSPDFRLHVIGRLLLPLLRHHDHEQVEIYCYSDVRKEDSYTAHSRKYADVWRQTAGMSDESLANVIRNDHIDILLETCGHFAGNRLKMMASRPAPIQITHFGYPDTTGMSTMDYRLTDALCDPVGLTDRFHTETLFRLEHCPWCYLPEIAGAKPSELPSSRNGIITFGCLNNLIKMTDPAVELWSRILAAVPRSKLMLLCEDNPETQRYIIDRFAKHGIPPDKLDLAGKRAHNAYMELYNSIDIGLDPFPFNGDNTAGDSLWSGVPFIALAGQTFLSRRGLSYLSLTGLLDLAAADTESYFQKAVSLANSPRKLVELRGGLRDRMLGSAVTDAKGFARRIEGAYRQMWSNWCDGRKRNQPD